MPDNKSTNIQHYNFKTQIPDKLHNHQILKVNTYPALAEFFFTSASASPSGTWQEQLVRINVGRLNRNPRVNESSGFQSVVNEELLQDKKGEQLGG